MDVVTQWALVLGSIFLLVAVSGSHLKELPFTRAIVYLIAGVILGPLGLNLVSIDLARDHFWIERVSQVAICIALFTAGLKLRAGMLDKIWMPAIWLSTISVAVAVVLAAAAGVLLLHLSWGMAIVLGAILSPTDPVLASDVELERPHDDDPLRFTFTTEAALNDCTAAPFLALGLVVLGLENGGLRWMHWGLVDAMGVTLGGLAVGAFTGALVGKAVVYLRRRKTAAVGFDDFVVLGLIAFSFGCAALLGANGFLAVFAAALALRQVELRSMAGPRKAGARMPAWDESDELATHNVQAAAYLAHTSLQFSERLGHLGELAIVILVGAMLTRGTFTLRALLFTAAVMLLVRPVSVQLGLLGSTCTQRERGLLSWFGIRGSASLYYLMAAGGSAGVGMSNPTIVQTTLLILSVSVLAHGITVTPLMNWYATKRNAAVEQKPGESTMQNQLNEGERDGASS